jgi:hypothetical protein
MRRQVKPASLSKIERGDEGACHLAPLVASHAKTNHAVAQPFRSQLCDAQGVIRAKLPNRIKDPAHSDRRCERRPRNSVKQRSYVLVFPEHNSDREIDFNIPDSLFVKAFEEPPSNELVILGTTKASAHKLISFHEAWEVAEGACLADFGRIQVGSELAEHIKIDRSLKVQMQLSLI